ncbi:MAG TPA: hypothetical protein VKD22_06720 [Ramlibacter sp.]|nr:hypothetical protein [Ramlibacter sp.]
MNNFFEHLPFDSARQLEQLSRLAFELREDAKSILRRYGVDTPEALLERIRAGAVPEHPGYEHYLSACILATTRETVRDQLAVTTRELAG